MRSKRISTWACALTLASAGYGQIEWHANPGGNFISAGEWFGADVNSTIPLRIRHNANQPIEFFTNNVQRMRLYQGITPVINGYAPLNRSGSLVLSSANAAFAAGVSPQSRLHLIDVGGNTNPNFISPVIGFRYWMRNGVTFTGNSDHGYLGQKYAVDGLGAQLADFTDMVLHWSSDVPGPDGLDRLRFLFTSDRDASPTGSHSEEGLEAMRFTPINEDEVNVGVGDFYAGNFLFPTTVVEPTERLDILTGRLRIRQLPTDLEAPTLTKVLVVDDANPITGETGVIKWRDISSIGGCSSGWSLNGTNAVTAFAGNPCPPQEVDKVGIGTNSPVGKLDVNVNSSFGFYDAAIRANVNTTTSVKVGVDANVSTEGDYTWGYRAKISGATNNTGIEVGVGAGSSAGLVRGGVYVVDGGGITPNNDLIGVYAKSFGATQGGNGWAFWAEGKSYSSTSATWSTSDEQLKQNIQEMDQEQALTDLVSIPLKTFEYNTTDYGFMGLEPGINRGLLAQDLEAIFPDLVRDMHRRGAVNEDGEQIEPDVDFKAVNMPGLIPLMIASIQAQQQTISTLTTQLSEMNERLNGCCAANNPGSNFQGNNNDMGNSATPENDRTLRIVPNPMQDQATIYYQLERSGRMQLLANSADGKELRVLKEAQMEAGNYQHDWATAGMAPGVYYVTLLLDGEPITKKVVKIAP